MNKFIYYLKFIGVFIIIELLLTLISSILNLLGVNSGITTLFLFVCNCILFLLLSFKNASNKTKNGYIEGLIIGLIYITIMIVLKLLFFTHFSIATFIYYIILLLISIVGGIFGVNKKSDD